MRHSNIRASAKIGSLLVIILLFLPPYLIFYPMGKKVRRLFSYPIFSYCVTCAGLTLLIKGKYNKNDVNLYVANHVSYLDIPILASLVDGLFVAKADVGKWPLIGFLARVGRTQFVSRKAIDTLKEREVLASHFKKGETIFLFPEGTSSGGGEVLPFKPGLLSSALISNDRTAVEIQPITLTYGPEISQTIRDYYAWYGDMELISHMWFLFGIKDKLPVTLTFHQSQCSSSFTNRKTLATWAEETIKTGLTQELNIQPSLTVLHST